MAPRNDSGGQQRLPLSELPPSPHRDEPPRSRRIYCNRDLRLDQSQLVGFDMDYTLAIYDQDELDRISIEATAEKLVQVGYPESLREMPFRPHFPIRGLLVDKRHGNVLKTDRYRYAKKAFHGTRELSSEERKKLYQHRRIRPGTRRYHSIDTLYGLSEVTVYSAAVDALDAGPDKLDYVELFNAVRAAIDQAHSDGTIKDRIMADPERFLVRDPDLPAMLHKLRSAGKKLFLLTNSESHYTERIMQHLIGGEGSQYGGWRSYFDIIISQAGKPGFFTRDAPFHDESGEGEPVDRFERGAIHTGGSLAEFRRLTDVRGDRVLYVGDHIYGDVLRAKKESAWRTLMIIQEMTGELQAIERGADDLDKLHRLEERRYELYDQLRDSQLRFKLISGELQEQDGKHAERAGMEATRLTLRRSVERLRGQIRNVERDFAHLEDRVARACHPYWGSVFKAESELSSFGEQVERYACLYADRVSNLLHYSTEHYFRAPRHRMAHE